ncbi:hypothetical protein PIB30_099859 [Stylosanthes scabra]|uniref:Uncharacterized protein n=1 Tax=Stylosanthes scabra TaxID=79078 RepID=A0ABU6QXA2_9FABA|nr:hypothetical protein [Stylosanthes scabra]
MQLQQHNDEEEEDQPMPQFEGGNEEDHNQGQHQHFQPQYHQDAGFQQHYMEQQQQGFTLLNEQLASVQIQQQNFFESMQSTQAQYLEELKLVKTRQDELWNNTNKFHH